jgi:hypothetical protein
MGVYLITRHDGHGGVLNKRAYDGFTGIRKLYFYAHNLFESLKMKYKISQKFI